MYDIKRLEYIEKQLVNHIPISQIKLIRKKIAEYIDEKEIDMINPFEKDKVIILAYLRLLRKRSVYLNNRHCKRYKCFTQQHRVPFDDLFWRKAVHIPNNQTDFLYLLSLWKQQVILLEKLWNDSLNQFLLDLYKKILEMLNKKCEVHYFEQLMSCLKNLEFCDEGRLDVLLEENGLISSSSTDMRLDQDGLEALREENGLIPSSSIDMSLDQGGLIPSSSTDMLLDQDGLIPSSSTDMSLDQDDLLPLFANKLTEMDNDIDTDFLAQLFIENPLSETGFTPRTTRQKLTFKEQKLFLSWDKKMSKDKNIRHLLEIIGKRMKLGNCATSGSNLFGELSGLKLGKDIQTVLPSELTQMTVPDLSYLFDLKYIEEKLLSFELNSPFFQDQHHLSNKQGAMILCLDTSGSMTIGERENIAKAVAYYLASHAIRQKRNCFIINFSEDIETFNVIKEPRKLVHFLSASFNGGTDVEPALEEALRMLDTSQYKNADVLVISDLWFPYIRYDLKINIEKQQKKGTTFNVLVVGDAEIVSSNIHFDAIFSVDDHGHTRNTKALFYS